MVVACLPERSQVLLNGTPPLCSVNEHKGGGYARFAHWRAISFGIGSAAFVLLSFEILPLGLYFLVHFEFGIALGIFVTVLNEYRDKVGE